jgi:hypothetical protein
MTTRKKIKSKLLLLLRDLGFLKKPYKHRRGIRVSRSVQPDGTVTEYQSPLREIPQNKHDLESAIHVFHEIKKSPIK